MLISFKEIQIILLNLFVTFSENTTDTSRSDDNVVRCRKQFVERDSWNVIKVVVGSAETLRHKTIEL